MFYPKGWQLVKCKDSKCGSCCKLVISLTGKGEMSPSNLASMVCSRIDLHFIMFTILSHKIKQQQKLD